jgi:hypothetical protein
MINSIKSPRFLVLSLMVLAAAATRALPLFIPHIWNFTAVGALAIFSGAQFTDKRLALAMPLAAMAISDLFIGNGFDAVVYSGFIAMVVCGMLISKRQNISKFFLGNITGAVIFFLITNFALFYPVSMYPHNLAGIIASYVAGLPFLNNMLAGNLIYGTVLFGSFYLLQQRFPSLAK